MLSCSCSKISNQTLLEQAGKAVLQTLKACQDGRPTNGPRVHSNRFYTAGFKALNSILATLRSQHGLSTAELVELLRHFFTYGIELSLGSTAVPTAAAFGHGSLRDSAPAGTARYQPPHARRRSSSSSAGKQCRSPHAPVPVIGDNANLAFCSRCKYNHVLLLSMVGFSACPSP